MNLKMSLGQFNFLFKIIRFFVAILIAFFISFIIISFSTSSPIKALFSIFIGPFTSVRRFSTVLESMIPLSFAGLAVCVMFKANQFNLAAEGAFFIGALVSAIVAINFHSTSFLVKLLAILLAGIFGSFVCFIPGILKVKLKCSEMVVSLMLNYVALYFGTFIFNQLIKDPNSAYKASYEFSKGTNLSNLIPRTRLHSGVFILIIFVILVYIFIYKTKWGYKLRITGSNLSHAKTVGINTSMIILMSQIVGGLIAGVGGGVEILGMYTRFQWSSLPGYGFDGVVINIIAQENPVFIPVAAFFVSLVRIGSDYMYKQYGIASEIVSIIEGLVIILVSANSFLAIWKHKIMTKVSKNNMEIKGK